MTQPMVRFAATHNSESLQGKTYLPKEKVGIVTITEATTHDFMTVAAGTYVEKVDLIVLTALSSGGTVEIGTDGNADEFIDTADYDEETVNTLITSDLSSTADSTGGKYFAAADTLRITVAGTATAGKVWFKIKYWEVANMDTYNVDEALTEVHFNLS